MSAKKNPVLELAKAQTSSNPALETEIGDFQVELSGDERGGTLTLTPPEGDALQITIEGGTLKLQYGGPRLQVSAPGAAIEFAARTIELSAEESVSIQGGREVDIHSGVDVEVRADHHVNLWGHDVLIGD
jgi:hypothetical protein